MDGPLRLAKFLLLVTQLADPSICDASATVSTFLFVQTCRPGHQQLDQTRQTNEMLLYFLAARLSRFSSVPSTIRYLLLEDFQKRRYHRTLFAFVSRHLRIVLPAVLNTMTFWKICSSSRTEILSGEPVAMMNRKLRPV